MNNLDKYIYIYIYGLKFQFGSMVNQRRDIQRIQRHQHHQSHTVESHQVKSSQTTTPTCTNKSWRVWQIPWVFLGGKYVMCSTLWPSNILRMLWHSKCNDRKFAHIVNLMFHHLSSTIELQQGVSLLLLHKCPLGSNTEKLVHLAPASNTSKPNQDRNDTRTEVKEDVRGVQGNNHSMECPTITCSWLFHLKPPNGWIKLGGHCNDGQTLRRQLQKTTSLAVERSYLATSKNRAKHHSATLAHLLRIINRI